LLNRIQIGYGGIASHDNCVVIGDRCTTTEENQIVIGDKLFGDPITDSVRAQLQAIAAQPEGLKFLIESFARIRG